MGMPLQYLDLLVQEHKRKPFKDPVLILGRQALYASIDDIHQLLARYGLEPATLPEGTDVRTNIAHWRGTENDRFTNDIVFFKLLGLSDILALDCSEYEGAEVIADLNLPVPHELTKRFGLIVDGGTSEHIFDVRQNLVNIASMLVPNGGLVIHQAPTNNYVNHGFYQFSPTIFYDFYATNGFTDLRSSLVFQPLAALEEEWEVVTYNPQTDGAQNAIRTREDQRLLYHFCAEKTVTSTVDRVPMQSLYQQLHG